MIQRLDFDTQGHLLYLEELHYVFFYVEDIEETKTAPDISG